MAAKKRGGGAATKTPKPTVIYFSAPWCMPCWTFGPLVEKLAKETGVTLVKVDVDDPPVEYKDEAGALRSVPVLSWVGDRPGVQRQFGALKRETLLEWFKVGVEDSKR